MTDEAEPETQPSAPPEPEQQTPSGLPPRLGTETADSFTVDKRGSGPDGTETRAS